MVGSKEYFIRQDAEDKRGVINLINPIKRVMVKDWDYVEKIWDHIFERELRINPAECNLLITHPVKDLKENIGKISQIMFETFKVRGLILSHPTLLSLYSCGKFDGLSIEFGDGSTQFSAIINGYEAPQYCERINIGGKDITKSFGKYLNTKGTNDKVPILNKSILRDIKEKSGYIPFDYNEELKSFKPFDYELPDGTHIMINEKRIKYPMSWIFEPKLKFREEKSIPEICNDLIMKCDLNKTKLYSNIILSGGNSLFKGLPEKFDRQIRALAPSSFKKIINVIANSERKFGAWIGGSILGGVSTSEQILIKKEKYEEEEGISFFEKYFA